MEGPSPWRDLGVLASVGVTFVVATALGLLGGYYLDLLLGSSPWLTLLGLALGIASGFRELFRTIKAVERQERDGP